MATKRNTKQKLLVWGYIREVEKVYEIANIPSEINDIIHLYQKICDKWSKKYSSKQIKIDEFESMIFAEQDDRSTVFGEAVVSEGIFTWRIQIMSMVE